MGYHKLAPVLFFAGMIALISYAYTAADASNIVKYSILYAIIVTGISISVLLFNKKISKIIIIKKQPAQKAAKKP